jgi:hypothetical protein
VPTSMGCAPAVRFALAIRAVLSAYPTAVLISSNSALPSDYEPAGLCYSQSTFAKACCHVLCSYPGPAWALPLAARRRRDQIAVPSGVLVPGRFSGTLLPALRCRDRDREFDGC